MAGRSAGILMYHSRGGELFVLLVHPGGPYWARKDLGAWTIPKGEYAPAEDPKLAALREFEEELGRRPEGDPVLLGEVMQKGGKQVTAFAMEGQFDADRIISNSFELEWPPRSGRRQSFPEIDRAAWFPLADARTKILASQAPLLDRLVTLLSSPPAP